MYILLFLILVFVISPTYFHHCHQFFINNTTLRASHLGANLTFIPSLIFEMENFKQKYLDETFAKKLIFFSVFRDTQERLPSSTNCAVRGEVSVNKKIHKNMGLIENHFFNSQQNI